MTAFGSQFVFAFFLPFCSISSHAGFFDRDGAYSARRRIEHEKDTPYTRNPINIVFIVFVALDDGTVPPSSLPSSRWITAQREHDFTRPHHAPNGVQFSCTQHRERKLGWGSIALTIVMPFFFVTSIFRAQACLQSLL